MAWAGLELRCCTRTAPSTTSTSLQNNGQQLTVCQQLPQPHTYVQSSMLSLHSTPTDHNLFAESRPHSFRPAGIILCSLAQHMWPAFQRASRRLQVSFLPYTTPDLPAVHRYFKGQSFVLAGLSIYIRERIDYAMVQSCPSGHLVGYASLLILLAGCCCSAQQGDWTSYSSSWDFANASSKLDAITQAQNSALLSLFDPSRPPAVGAEAQVGAQYRTSSRRGLGFRA